MLERYAEFRMRRSPKGFGRVVVESIAQLDNLLASAGVTIVDLSDVYDSHKIVDKAARVLDQLLGYFELQEDSEDLMLLIVVEQAHLWT